jgi:thiosulfate dehydrogenase (quinone) large subunit
MNDVTMDRRFVLAFRLMMGWTFFYAGAWQVMSPDFTVAAFLAHTKTFHDIYAPLTSPAIAPILTFLVSTAAA